MDNREPRLRAKRIIELPPCGRTHSFSIFHSQFFFRWHNRALMLHGIRRTFGRKRQIIRKFLLWDICERFRCHAVAGKLIQERPDERIARSGGIRDRHRQRFGLGARVRRVDCRAVRAACHKQQPATPRKQKLCRFPLGFAADAEFNFIIRQLHEVCTRQKLTNRCLTAFRAVPQRQTHVRVE